MAATPAQVVRQRRPHLGLGGLRCAPQQGHGGDDHAVQAVATLRSLGLDKRLLHRMQRRSAAQSFQRRHLATRHTRQRQRTGPRRPAVDQHHAGAAFPQAATVLGAVQAQVVAQHREQRHGAVHRQGFNPAVDVQQDSGRAQKCKGPDQASSMSLLWMRLTPLAVICFQAAASEPFRSMARQASSTTNTSKPAARASIAVQPTQKSVARPVT